MKLIASTIKGNADWGVGAWLKQGNSPLCDESRTDRALAIRHPDNYASTSAWDPSTITHRGSETLPRKGLALTAEKVCEWKEKTLGAGTAVSDVKSSDPNTVEAKGENRASGGVVKYHCIKATKGNPVTITYDYYSTKGPLGETKSGSFTVECK